MTSCSRRLVVEEEEEEEKKKSVTHTLVYFPASTSFVQTQLLSSAVIDVCCTWSVSRASVSRSEDTAPLSPCVYDWFLKSTAASVTAHFRLVVLLWLWLSARALICKHTRKHETLPHLHEDEAGDDGVAPQGVVGSHLASCQLTQVRLSLRRHKVQELSRHHIVLGAAQRTVWFWTSSLSTGSRLVLHKFLPDFTSVPH